MNLRVPPVVVFVVFGGAMYLLAKFLPVGDFDFFGKYYLIWLLVVMAFGIGTVALAHFVLAKTTIDPTAPSKATSLVHKGLYRFSRNPMYLAMLLLLLALGLWLGNAFNTLLAAGFVGYMNKFQIAPEEEALQTLFGKEYQRYCGNVRRWF